MVKSKWMNVIKLNTSHHKVHEFLSSNAFDLHHELDRFIGYLNWMRFGKDCGKDAIFWDSLHGTCDVVVVGLCASLVALVEVVARWALAQADGHSAGATSIALAIAGDVYVGDVGAHTPVQLAAYVESVAARELLEVEVLAKWTAQVLGLRVVLAGDGAVTDIVVGAGLVVGKVANASGSGGTVQAEGVFRFRQGGTLVAGHLSHIHAVAEISIVGTGHWTGSAVQDLADALVVLVTVDGIGQTGVVRQGSAGGTGLLRLADGATVLLFVHARPRYGMEDQLVGTVGLDLLVRLAQDVAATIAAAGIHDEGAFRFVGAQVRGLVRNAVGIGTHRGAGGCQDAAA